MNITPMQNNSQSFGMAFRLKGDGAKKLATLLYDVNTEQASHITEELIKRIHASNTDVIYDGKDVIIKASSEFVPGMYRKGEEPRIVDLVVSDKAPVVDNKNFWQYQVNGGSTIFKRQYLKNCPSLQPPRLEPEAISQQLSNAKEIVRYLDYKAAGKFFLTGLDALKEATIAAKTKELLDLYG